MMDSSYPPEAVAADRSRIHWIEFIVVTLYLVVPYLFSGFFSRETLHDPLYYVYSSFFAAGQIGVVLFIIWAVDGSLADTGIEKANVLIDVPLSIVIAAVYAALIYVQSGYAHGAFSQQDLTVISKRVILVSPQSAPIWLPLGTCLFWSFGREVMSRSYVMGRLLRFSNPWLAVLGPAFLFALPALAYGFPLAIVDCLLGIMFGLSFLFTRRIWAGFGAHVIIYVLTILSAYGALAIVK